ncbi:MAG: hypothetical protein AAF417_03490 [Pseudomonadota bacterium]
MDWAEFNWLYLGFAIWGAAWICFAAVARRGERSGFALIVGLAHMIIVMLNSVAPLRGALDPNYEGFRFLVLEVDPGLAVTAVAGSLFLASFSCALIAVQNRGGPAMRVVEIWSAVLAVTLGIPLFVGLFTDPTSFAINLGEYASIPWYLAFPLLIGVVVFPFALAVPWAHRRARDLD